MSAAQTATDLELLVKTHADLMARYDALTQLRNGATLANAGFAGALAAALQGDVDRAAAGVEAANATLAASCGFWQAVSAGRAYGDTGIQTPTASDKKPKARAGR